MTDPECVSFLQWALPRLSLRWLGFRKVRRLVCKRLRRRLTELGVPSLAAYSLWLAVHPDEWAILDAICRIPISRFYRDRGVFDQLGGIVLPRLAGRALERADNQIECWCAGCASGEEVYSLRIAWLLAGAQVPGVKVHILGTDVDPHMIERARWGCYPEGCLKELPPTWRDLAFTRTGMELCELERFRTNTDFLVQDIRREMPNGLFDLIFCRNLVFTYFDEFLQRTLLAKLRERLRAGGFLVLKIHERLPEGSSGFVNFGRAIYLAEQRAATWDEGDPRGEP